MFGPVRRCKHVTSISFPRIFIAWEGAMTNDAMLRTYLGTRCFGALTYDNVVEGGFTPGA